MRASLTVILMMASWIAAGQAPSDPLNSEQVETASQTIAKALADLASRNAKDRERAVLVLGKYDEMTATLALVKALSDSEARIRQSAIVYLIERPLPPDQAIAAVRMVGDKEVSIRRIASSALQRTLSWYWRMRMLGNGTDRGGLPPDVQKLLIKACDDSDATVRKSMVAAWSLLRMCDVAIGEDLIMRRLSDDNREVRILALESACHMLPPDKHAVALMPLTADKDRLIRLNLARILGRFPVHAANPILKKLTADNDFEVSTEAMVALLRGGQSSYWTELRKRLDDRRTKSTLAKMIIASLPYMRTGRDELFELMKHPNATYRLSALETYRDRFWDGGNADIAFDLQADTSAAIRKAAGDLLSKSSTPLPAAKVKALTKSKFVDVRRLAVIMCSQIDRKAAEEVAIELLLDDDAETRRHALLLIAVKKFAGWVSVMGDSLEDDDKRIQQQAVMILLEENPPEAGKILDKFVKTTKNSDLRKFIEQQRTLYESQRLRIPQRPPSIYERRSPEAPTPTP